MEEKQIQGIQNFDNNPFVSNQQNVTIQTDKILLDFKNIYSQFDPANNETIIINHKMIILDPYIAKLFAGIVNNSITEYEKQFGKIAKPKAMAKAEEIAKTKTKPSSSTFHSYMG